MKIPMVKRSKTRSKIGARRILRKGASVIESESNDDLLLPRAKRRAAINAVYEAPQAQ